MMIPQYLNDRAARRGFTPHFVHPLLRVVYDPEYTRSREEDREAADAAIEAEGGLEAAARRFLPARAGYREEQRARQWPAEMVAGQVWLDVVISRIVERVAQEARCEGWFSGIDNSIPSSPHFHPAARPGKPRGLASPEAFEAQGWHYVGGMGNTNSTSLYYVWPASLPDWLRPHLQRTDVRGGKMECLRHSIEKALAAMCGQNVSQWR